MTADAIGVALHGPTDTVNAAEAADDDGR